MWREASLKEVCEFMQGRLWAEDITTNEVDCGREGTGIRFSDGTKVVCTSKWESWGGTEVTPGETYEMPPQFFIYEPKERP